MGISLKNELTNETKSSEFFIFSEKLQSIWKQFWPVIMEGSSPLNHASELLIASYSFRNLFSGILSEDCSLFFLSDILYKYSNNFFFNR